MVISPTHRYWFNRFEARPLADGCYAVRDWLQPAGRVLGPEVVAGLQGRALDLALFQYGFARAALSSYGAPVAQNHLAGHSPDGGPGQENAVLFWQFPCRTEAAAWNAHAGLNCPRLIDDVMHVYLGLPWATWIDKARNFAWGTEGAGVMQQQLQLVGVQLSGLRRALSALGVQLRVHSVCQHIYWFDLVPAWQKLGVTDLWLSHCPQAGATLVSVPPVPLPDLGELQLHPWALYAVNVEDPQRRAGLALGKDVDQRTILASFVGAHMAHYLSDVRLQLQTLAGTPGFVVRVSGDWHFNTVVYQHQIAGQALTPTPRLDAEVASYNQLLSDSVFALCPAGAGPNSLRLWEALAVGAIPVLLGNQPVLPCGGTLAAVDWDRIVLRVADAQIDQLPTLLKGMPLAERRERQVRGMEAYAAVKVQRCF
jgi:hypothetical protein